MLIDRFLPEYQFGSQYRIEVRASVAATYERVRVLDLSDSTLTRWLFRLRGLPREALTRRGLLRLGFVQLAEEPRRELVLGIAGRFWTLHGGIVDLTPEAFREFDRPGFAKSVWNFSIEEQGDGLTRLATETRIQCLDEASKRSFSLYWAVVGPFSAWIRREALRTLKRQAESGVSPARDG